jgi:PAS domain-containing protein
MIDHCDVAQLEAGVNELETDAVQVNKLKEALEESEDRYNRLLENLENEFIFYRHDTNGNFTSISPSYANILGYAPEEYIGFNAMELWTPNPINA